MLIKDGKAGTPGVLVRPSALAGAAEAEADAAGEVDSKAAEQASARLAELQGRAAWLATLVYRDTAGLERLLVELGARDFVPIVDDGLSTVACGFVLDGRTWLVFRGSDDDNDWARNLMCLPAYHFGFNRCYADIAEKLKQWTERVAPMGHPFCVVGHSLGGALATLATRRIAGDRCAVEMLCTFGAPRVFAPWQASFFDRMPANLADQPALRLSDVTYRFVDRFELVCYTPPALAGFKHVGRQIECEDVSDGPKRASDGRWEDAKYAFTQAFAAPVVGPWLALTRTVVALIGRGARAPNAHNMARYARRVDRVGAQRLSPDQSERVGESASAEIRRSSRVIMAALKLAAVISGLALLAAVLWGLWWLALNAPWETLSGALLFAGGIFVTNYLQRRNERRLNPYATSGSGLGLWASKSPGRRSGDRDEAVQHPLAP